MPVGSMAGDQARRDFGSFHSSNVQELLAMPESDYHPPAMPFQLPSFSHYATSKPQFGKTCRQQHFLLEEGCTFLNHGAFGGVLSQALKVAQQWQQYEGRQPLRFFDRELFPHLVYVTRRLAQFVGSDPQDIALVENATTGICSVLRSFKFSCGDVILSLNVTYGAVKKMLKQVCEDTGAVVREVIITFPVTEEQQVVDAVKAALSEGEVKLAVLDHIPSNAPIILPLSKIIPLCHQHNVQVLVDGAHGLGALPLDLQQLDPDFYVSNAHKWFCSPKGLRDFSALLAVHTVLDFWQAVGPDTIRSYIHHLVQYTADTLTSVWKTQLAAPLSMFGSMILVELPKSLYAADQQVDYTAAEHVQNTLYHEHNIEVPVKAIQGRLYVRVSLHIHNSEGDIDTLAAAVNKCAANPS